VTTGRADLEVDPLSLLFCHDFISQDAYLAGRKYSAMVSIARYAMGLPQGSVSGLWARLVAGTDTPAYGTPLRNDEAPDSCEGARFRVERMNAELQRRGEDEAMRRVVVNVTVDRQWVGWVRRLLTRMPELPGDYHALGLLREGLQRLCDMARRRTEAPRAEAAE
jgi:hypothetical protein